MNVNLSGMYKVCVSEFHQNVNLILLSLPVKTDYKGAICKAGCNIDAWNCVLLVKTVLENKVSKNYLTHWFANNENECSEYPLTKP